LVALKHANFLFGPWLLPTPSQLAPARRACRHRTTSTRRPDASWASWTSPSAAAATPSPRPRPTPIGCATRRAKRWSSRPRKSSTAARTKSGLAQYVQHAPPKKTN
jgi:hypothetical protein